jgi:hypothetical protein
LTSLPKINREANGHTIAALVPGLEAGLSIKLNLASAVPPEPASLETTKEPTPILDAGTASPDSNNVPVVIADNLAPELQPAADATNSTVGHPSPRWLHADSSQVPASLSIPPVTFVPYSSPLKMFKAYRYHSNFRNDVPGGFKSLTYSNTIDPSLPLCPIEMAGAICEDPGCIGQHMRDMGLAGMSFLIFTTHRVG